MSIEKLKKYIINFILFIALIILTYYVVFKDQDVTDLGNVLSGAKIQYVLIACAAMCGYVLCDAINTRRMLGLLKEKIGFWKSIKYSLIGCFFSGITPAASGGQPMQIYYMHKEKISVAHATLALLINLSCIQVATISIALVSVLCNFHNMNSVLAVMFIIGIALNAIALSLLIIAVTSKNMTKGILNFTIKVIKKLRLKNLESKVQNLKKEMARYHFSSKYIKNNKKAIIYNLLTTYLQFIFLYSVSYWIYLAFGFSGQNFWQIFTLQAVLYGSVSGIPLPGSIGVSEGGFIEIYRLIYPDGMIKGVMLLNRAVNFYLLMAISGIVVLGNIFITKKQLKKEEI